MKDNQEHLLCGKNFDEVMKDIAVELKSLKVTDSEMECAAILLEETFIRLKNGLNLPEDAFARNGAKASRSRKTDCKSKGRFIFGKRGNGLWAYPSLCLS
ncbi:MAG: hypothetical protein IKN43_13715 [Selenomonadaceae bacterium]|nr:hypothetical protein [Selenomonadaceae bacterium]